MKLQSDIEQKENINLMKRKEELEKDGNWLGIDKILVCGLGAWYNLKSFWFIMQIFHSYPMNQVSFWMLYLE